MADRTEIQQCIDRLFESKASHILSMRHWLLVDFLRGLDAIAKKYDERAMAAMKIIDPDEPALSLSAPLFDQRFNASKHNHHNVQNGDIRTSFDEIEVCAAGYSKTKEYDVFFRQDFFRCIQELHEGREATAHDYLSFQHARQTAEALGKHYKAMAPDEFKPGQLAFDAYLGFINEMISLLPRPGYVYNASNSKPTQQLPFGNR